MVAVAVAVAVAALGTEVRVRMDPLVLAGISMGEIQDLCTVVTIKLRCISGPVEDVETILQAAMAAALSTYPR